MSKVIKQIEYNINSLLDIYDEAIAAVKKAATIEREKKHEEIAFDAVKRINYEMDKLQSLKSFEPEIRVVTSGTTICIDKGRELQH